jgi:hypothetical protein
MFGTIEKRPVFETCVARINGRPAAMQTNRINQERMESAGEK